MISDSDVFLHSKNLFLHTISSMVESYLLRSVYGVFKDWKGRFWLDCRLTGAFWWRKWNLILWLKLEEQGKNLNFSFEDFCRFLSTMCALFNQVCFKREYLKQKWHWNLPAKWKIKTQFRRTLNSAETLFALINSLKMFYLRNLLNDLIISMLRKEGPQHKSRYQSNVSLYFKLKRIGTDKKVIRHKIEINEIKELKFPIWYGLNETIKLNKKRWIIENHLEEITWGRPEKFMPQM